MPSDRNGQDGKSLMLPIIQMNSTSARSINNNASRREPTETAINSALESHETMPCVSPGPYLAQIDRTPTPSRVRNHHNSAAELTKRSASGKRTSSSANLTMKRSINTHDEAKDSLQGQPAPVKGNCWRWLRAAFLWFPGCHKHGNSFLSELILATCGQLLLLYVIQIVGYSALYDANVKSIRSRVEDPERLKAIQEGSCMLDLQAGYDFLGFAVTGNIILALPALPMVRCRLLKENIQYEDVTIQFKKTFLMSFCEITQLATILMLVFLPILMVFQVWLVYPDCHETLDSSYFACYLVMQAIDLVSYILRWHQVILFHQLHEHLCLQRGFWRDADRFVYDGQSFMDLCTCFWTRRDKVRLRVKLYNAARIGNLEQVRAAVQVAQQLDGSDFASKWYNCGSAEPRDRHGKLFYVWQQYFCRCQRNPLHVAIAFGHLSVVQYLVDEARFDVNGYERMELLRLDLSSLYRNFMEYIWLFSRNSPRKQIRELFGPWGTLLTPLHVAITMTHHDIGRYLIEKGAKPDGLAHSRHWRFCTPPLFWATTESCVELLLLQADANHLHVPGHGFFLTPYESARMQHFTCVATELEIYGGDVALTPLHVACADGDESRVAQLLRFGADANSLGERCVGLFQRTPLHWAAMRGQHHVIPLLLQYGACVDEVDCFGRTALAWACFFRRLECVRVLLEANADPNVRDLDGIPILCLCAASPVVTHERGGVELMVVESSQHSQNTARIDRDPVLNFFAELLALWKSHQGDLGLACDQNGDTALHVALRHGNQQAAIALVRAGLSLTLSNQFGQRAIDCTTSSSTRYAVKKEAGFRDVMISYCHAHAQFAWKVRNALEQAYVTTWMDQMDPTGITGGSVWRQEIAQAIEHSTLMLCILCEHYPKSQWCMKELAFAKLTETPVVAITCEQVELDDEMQMYLYTRQIVDFQSSIVVVHGSDKLVTEEAIEGSTNTVSSSSQGQPVEGVAVVAKTDEQNLNDNGGEKDDSTSTIQAKGCWFEYDDVVFDEQMKMLLDGIRDEMELQHKQRLHEQQWQEQQDAQYPASDADGGSASATEPTRRIRRIDSMLRESSVCSTQANGSMIGQSVDATNSNAEFTNSQRFLRPSSVPLGLNHSPLRPITGTSSPGRGNKLSVFISHGDCHQAFCQRLQQFLVDSTTRSASGRRLVSRLPQIPGSPSASNVGSSSETRTSFVDATDVRPRTRTRTLSSSSQMMTLVGTTRGSFVDVFIDSSTKMRSGQNALIECDALIVILSSKSITSSRLADQLAFAEDHGKAIIPIVLSVFEVDAAKRYTFSRRQAMERMHHFHEAIGFQQSAEDLAKTLRHCWQQQQQQLQRPRQWSGSSVGTPRHGMPPANSSSRSIISSAGNVTPSSSAAFALSPTNPGGLLLSSGAHTGQATPQDEIALAERPSQLLQTKSSSRGHGLGLPKRPTP